MSMRIIAGLGKGRKLFSPPSITRPTSDRAREGLFSSLTSTFTTLDGLHFLDLMLVPAQLVSKPFPEGQRWLKRLRAIQLARKSVKIILH